MTNKVAGWVLGIAALGMMMGLMSHDISELKSWNDATQPVFVASMCAHFSTVVLAFIGGKLIPTEPQNQRKDD